MLRIAVDGPSGSGKGFLAKELAEYFGITYLDTGAIYRTVGVFAIKNSIDPHSAEAMAPYLSAEHIKISFDFNEEGQVMFLNDEDVTAEIRTPQASMYASAVSALPCVRAFLLDLQKDLAARMSVVMDGRDIGTVIMPEADVKIFLTADAEVRAERRVAQLREKGKNATFEEVLADMKQRDAQDAGREIAPAMAADDAVILDNTLLNREQTVETALNIVKSKRPDLF